MIHLLAELGVLVSACILVGVVTYCIAHRRGRNFEVRDRMRRVESMYDSMAVTWDETTLPRKWYQPGSTLRN